MPIVEKLRVDSLVLFGAACCAGCEQPTAPAPVGSTGAEVEAASTEGEAKPNKASLPLIDQTFDDIKFDIEPDGDFERSMLTDKIRELDGRRLRIRGYILPTARKRGIKEFVLVRDNQECCFGPGAALYDCILVKMHEGESTEFSVRPVAVEGAFRVEEFYGPDERPLAIYQLKGEKVD
ncbi:hypothetical protein MalM25_02520 [Planctomycetes bacterium MalM25]|nr:hypothetical protein MalM25_02520 [Planctomycetes bacterium MalM25]